MTSFPASADGKATGSSREADLLSKAAQFSFRARMDKKTNEGPVFERGLGSVVWDVNDKEYLDFNSGQMCAALGHNHPTVTAAIKDACDTMLHAHSSHYNVKEVELAARLGEIVPRPLQKSRRFQAGMQGMDLYRVGHTRLSRRIAIDAHSIKPTRAASSPV